MTSSVSPIAPTSIQRTPRNPIASPLRIEATRKATPLAVPTRPLARSRPASGTRMVTSVESAIARTLPTIAPTSVSTMKSPQGDAGRVGEGGRRRGDEDGEGEGVEGERADARRQHHALLRVAIDQRAEEEPGDGDRRRCRRRP